MLMQPTLTSDSVLKRRTRIANVDIVRGIVMVIMALDHVRDLWSATPFRPEDLSQTSPLLFFTRWITHFCAPVFVFLSGVSVYLYGSRQQSQRKVRRYLLSRGLVLVVAEIFVVTFLLQFAYQIILLQVIWVIGWSMVFLSLILPLRRKYILFLGLIIIAGHNLLPDIQPVTINNILPAILHNSPFIVYLGKLPVLVSYSIIPWVGVMMTGYGIGDWFTAARKYQNGKLVLAGCILLGLFAVLRATNVYGDQIPWESQERGMLYSILSFINVSKYPPSLLFLCLTLGVALLALAAFNKPDAALPSEQRRISLTSILQVYGRVPFFYFLLHLGVIVAGAYTWTLIRFNTITNFAFMPPDQWPEGYEPSLLRTYVVWIVVVVILYFPCRWYSRYKSEHRARWLSFL